MSSTETKVVLLFIRLKVEYMLEKNQTMKDF